LSLAAKIDADFISLLLAGAKVEEVETGRDRGRIIGSRSTVGGFEEGEMKMSTASRRIFQA